MTWHAAGTYRIADGRGGGGEGAQRFAPLNSWPDNANLDKARRLLWPIKQKYGQKISWADLLVFAGNVAMESMGFKTFGFGFGRPGHLGARGDLLGPRGHLARRRALQRRPRARRPARRRADGPDLRQPGGPERQARSARRRPRHPRDVRPHGDERRGDGGADHRRPHLRQGARRRPRPTTSGPSPRPRRSSSRASAGRTRTAAATGGDTITSGLEGAWTNKPTKWDNGFLENLFEYEWELTESPAGAKQWTPKNPEAQGTVPDAHDPSKRHAPMMLTTDLALRMDPIYEPIAKRFYENPDELAEAFAKAWYKLLHRDMGPVSRYLGPWVPEPQLWQDPVPAVDHELVDDADVAALKAKLLDIGAVRLPARVHGLGVGGQLPRHRQARRRERRADPARAAEGLGGQRAGRAGQGAAGPRADPAGVQRSQSGGKRISLADLIVLGGCAAVEQAAKDAGHDVTVPFAPGRTDASQEQTDVESFAVLEPRADGFRNYLAPGEKLSPETLLLDRANMLTLTAPEMTVLVGGMRALGANVGQSPARRLHRPARDADQRLLREPARHGHGVAAVRRRRGRLRGPRPRAPARSSGPPPPSTWSSARTRSCARIAEVYASDDAQGEVRARLRRRLGQGHEPRPVRPAPLRKGAGGRLRGGAAAGARDAARGDRPRNRVPPP